MDTRSTLSIRIDTLQRHLMVNTASKLLPLYIVTEYPKSGGTWLGQLLGHYFDVPFPRNRRPALTSCIMHGHYLHSPLMRNVFCMIRDGRDVMVSFYYYSLNYNDRNSSTLVNRTRKHNQFMDYDDIISNLPRFIEYLFTIENKRLFHFNWSEFIDSWYGRNGAYFVKYEDLLDDVARTLSTPIEAITHKPADMAKLKQAEHMFSFSKVTNRKPGEEDKKSFLRKGIAGDWMNHFSKEACDIFDYYAGEHLIRLGYETDRTWIIKQGERMAR